MENRKESTINKIKKQRAPGRITPPPITVPWDIKAGDLIEIYKDGTRLAGKVLDAVNNGSPNFPHWIIQFTDNLDGWITWEQDAGQGYVSGWKEQYFG